MESRFGKADGSGGTTMTAVYVCNNHITGIFSALYDAWKSGRDEASCEIAIRGSIEQKLFCEYLEVEETQHKAKAVENLIIKHLGRQAYWDIYHAAHSEDCEKGNAILGTMLAARTLSDSRRIMEHLSHPKVRKVFELSRSVGGETHAFKGFLRFRELANGVLFSEIEPKSQLLSCLAPHFADRLPAENWMIYDKSHHMFAVHEAGKQWILAAGEQIDKEKTKLVSEQEIEFVRLWKGFVKSISIESRESIKRQKQNLPLRYRPNMAEFAQSE